MEKAGVMAGRMITEGKTKQIFEHTSGNILVVSKDRITAFNGVKGHNMEGKAKISTDTTAAAFEILLRAGIKCAYFKRYSATSFQAKQCDMIPIEWVTRRLATGSYLKRNPGVTEGTLFTPPLQETFYKDDANNDPQWNEQQIICAKLEANKVLIDEEKIELIKKISLAAFEILEKIWASRNCVLVDMKLEFGVDKEGNILLADVIDSDSWRLWPLGNKELMKDKQLYRNLKQVTDEDLQVVKNNFEWVAQELRAVLTFAKALVVIVMGSASDQEHGTNIGKCCQSLGLDVELRVVSVHKSTEKLLRMKYFYEGRGEPLVYIAVAGRSNGLGPTLAGNTNFPVINCPPLTHHTVQTDIWSSLNIPSGVGCSTTLHAESAALMAAHIHSLTNLLVWLKLRVKQLDNAMKIEESDQNARQKIIA